MDDLQEKVEYLERLVARQEKLIITYMNKNQDLWLALAKFPGGLEEARRLGSPVL